MLLNIQKPVCRRVRNPFGLASERGGSVVVAAVALPLLLTFLLAIGDIGRVVFLGAEANTAAHAVRRAVEERPDMISRPGDLYATALDASPLLAGNEVELRVHVEVGDAEEQAYGHKLFDRGERAFFERPARVRTRDITADVSVQGRYTTVVGMLISRLQGAYDQEFCCKAQAQGLIDETVEGGVW